MKRGIVVLVACLAVWAGCGKKPPSQQGPSDKEAVKLYLKWRAEKHPHAGPTSAEVKQRGADGAVRFVVRISANRLNGEAFIATSLQDCRLGRNAFKEWGVKDCEPQKATD